MNVTVSQVNAYVKQCLSMDAVLNDITVVGEISGLKFHSSGHIYFALKDESATIRCAFFKPHTFSLKFRPAEGMKVQARGRITLFERDGQYQLNVTELTEDGQGKLFAEFEKLKKKLAEEGLFDERFKRPIPPYAKKIGVITSPTGAVFHDICQVATRRCPGVSIVLAPVQVQGPDAPRSLIAGLKALELREDIDVLIIGRGGGSVEDLWCFNDEALARTIFACKKPIISAVGHETDFTIADFVADLRAPTPSAAAELAVFDYEELCDELVRAERILNQTVRAELSRIRVALYQAAEQFEDPTHLLTKQQQKIALLSERLTHAQSLRFTDKTNQLANLAGRLNALSPLKVLDRGYAVVQGKDGAALTAPAETGETIHIRLAQGSMNAEVIDYERN